jgi:hypothetical protein
MIPAILAAVIFTGAIAWWIFTPEDEDQRDVSREAWVQSLREKKQVAFENLKDLHFEYLAGKLTEEDYRRSREMLEREAARLTAEIQRAAASQPRTA